MGSRLLLPVLGVFWAVMSVLLWRAEYAGTGSAAIPVEPEMVWEKMLTSPDPSSLAILHRDKRIGFCHLITSVIDNVTPSLRTNAPAGMVRHIGHYRLDLSGTLNDFDDRTDIRFDGALTLSRSREWENFRVQIITRPSFITVESKRSDGLVHLTIESPGLSAQRSLRLQDFSQPQSLLAELFNSTALGTRNALPFLVPTAPSPTVHAPVRCTASTERWMFGHSASQIYRLELKAMKGYEVTILISRAGEILRVELPEHLTLMNEALTAR